MFKFNKLETISGSKNKMLYKVLDFLKVVLLLFIASLVGQIVSSLIQTAFPPNSNVTQICSLIVQYSFYLVVIMFAFPQPIKFHKNIWKFSYFWSGLLGLALIIFGFANIFLLNLLSLVSLNYNFYLESNPQIFRFGLAEFLSLIVLFLIQTLAEEWIFRGWILNFFQSIFSQVFSPKLNGNLNTNYTTLFSIILSSLLFGLMHIPGSNFPVANFLTTFMLGLVWGYIAVQTKSFLNAWPIHFINNLFFTFILGYNQFFFAESAVFKLDNLPNNFAWITIFIIINLILLNKVNSTILENKSESN